MLTRKSFTWDVTIADAANGATVQRKFTSFWSPEKTSNESVAVACAAMETAKTKGKRPFLPISAALAPTV